MDGTTHPPSVPRLRRLVSPTATRFSGLARRFFRRVPKSRQGFSILGLIVAAAMITVGIVGVAGLTVATLRTTRVSNNRFVALALAREGLELTRSLRDDNWFSYDRGWTDVAGRGIKWRGGFDTAAEIRRLICTTGTTRTSRIEPENNVAPDSQNARLSGTNTTKLMLNENFPLNGYAYSHKGGSGVPTVFRRQVRIVPSTVEDCGVEVQKNANPEPAILTVVSRVHWREKSADPWQCVELQEHLADWVRER